MSSWSAVVGVLLAVVSLVVAEGTAKLQVECHCELKGAGGVLLHNFKNITSYGPFTPATSCQHLRHQCIDECDDVIGKLADESGVPFMVFMGRDDEGAFGVTLCERYRRHAPRSFSVQHGLMTELPMHTQSTLRNCEAPGQSRRLRHRRGKLSFAHALCCGREQMEVENNKMKKVNVWYPQCRTGMYASRPHLSGKETW